MPSISRGSDMVGLVRYLVGPGRSDEHVEPHLVGGDPAVLAWWDDAVLDPGAAVAIGKHLDHPRRAFGVEVSGGDVWYVSLSLPASEGRIPDELWAEITADFMERMHGPSGGDETEGGRAPLRWIAVHHGPSRGGNDHVHIAASLVREDGTKATTWRDMPRSQAVARTLEEKYGLQVLESRARGRGERGISRAELERAKRLNLPEPERRSLARKVRGCAAASSDEAEFVRRLRAAGLVVTARYAAGTSDTVVSGYAVGERPTDGGQPFLLGGNNLAGDLSLPRLREFAGWPDTAEASAAAVAEWTAAKRDRPPVAPGVETTPPSAAEWQRAEADLAAWREELRAVPVEDTAAWAWVAGQTAGALAAWSTATEAVPGPLAHAADAVARSAQVRGQVTRGHRPAGPGARGAAMLLASIAHGGRGTVAEAVLLRQLANTAKALHDAHAATGDAKRAAEIARAARRDLALVAAGLPTPPAPPQPVVRGLGGLVTRPVGSVLPADLIHTRSTPAATGRPGPSRGGDRGR